MPVPEKFVQKATKAIHHYDLNAGLSGYYRPTVHHREEALAALEAVQGELEADALLEVARGLYDLEDGSVMDTYRVEFSEYLRHLAEIKKGQV